MCLGVVGVSEVAGAKQLEVAVLVVRELIVLDQKVRIKSLVAVRTLETTLVVRLISKEGGTKSKGGRGG